MGFIKMWAKVRKLRGSDKWNLRGIEESKCPEFKEPRSQDAKNQRKNAKENQEPKKEYKRIKFQGLHDKPGAFEICSLEFLWFLVLDLGHFGSCFLPHYPTFAAKIEIKL